MAEKYGNRFGAVNGQSADGVREFFGMSIALDNGEGIGWWKRRGRDAGRVERIHKRKLGLKDVRSETRHV